MAYLVDLDRPCARCKKRRATKRLMNRVNAKMADYCTTCAPRAQAELKKQYATIDAQGYGPAHVADSPLDE